MLPARCYQQDAITKMLPARCYQQDAITKMLLPRCYYQDATSKMLPARCYQQDVTSKMLQPHHIGIRSALHFMCEIAVTISPCHPAPSVADGLVLAEICPKQCVGVSAQYQVYLFLGRCGELIVHIYGNKTIFTLLHREYSQWFLGIVL